MVSEVILLLDGSNKIQLKQCAVLRVMKSSSKQ